MLIIEDNFFITTIFPRTLHKRKIKSNIIRIKLDNISIKLDIIQIKSDNILITTLIILMISEKKKILSQINSLRKDKRKK